MPRFVVLEHDHPVLHWDLMLEAGDALDTWRLAETPRAGAQCNAVRIDRHRLDYLHYEGPVSGNRGQVRRWDAGDFDWLQQADNLVEVRLSGGRLTGVWRLEWQAGDTWQLTFVPATE
jgi:hypothetical protein